QPQIEANETLEDIEHPITGEMRIVRSPARFGGTRLPVARPSPGHGEHTLEVLSEIGIDVEAFERLKDDGVVL
ncbi:MAG: CoA transferase, partial [Gammaproteobacteria bacterium]|nr:CoA transferase [Gammaproteobacteria bacterium]